MANNPIFSANATNFAARPIPPVVSQPAPVQSPAMSMPQCNLIWVDSKDAVLNHPATPNETLYFGFAGDEPIMWVRETDANGRIKNPLHKLRYSIEEDAFGPEAQFVTKEEHQKLYDLVNSVSQKLDELLK